MNEKIAEYYKLLFKHGATSKEIDDFEAKYVNNEALIKQVKTIKKDFTSRRRKT